jgi:HSP20 family protein
MKSEIFKNTDKQMISDEESLFNDNLFESIDTGFHLSEMDDCYLAEIDASGMKKEDFSVHIESRVLYITGEHKDESVKKQEDYNCKEFKFKSFQQSFLLPEDANEEKVDVRIKKDKLIVKIPKDISKNKSYYRKYVSIDVSEDEFDNSYKRREESFGEKLGKLWNAIKKRFSNK